MLLSLMRKHAKSYLIKFLIAIIAIVFIFYFGYSFTSHEGMRIATVNGEPISGVEYQKAYRTLLEALQKQYKDFWNENLIKTFDLKNRALEGLIQEKLISQEAMRMGLEVTDKEVQDQILSYPSFQFNGRFDESRYRMLLANNHMKPEEFEEEIARQLLRRKIEQFLSAFLPITDQEVADFFTLSKERVKISFVRFNPEDFKSSVTIDESALETYFKENQESYRIPKKLKIRYILIDSDQFKDVVSVSEQQVRDFYEENIEIYKEKKQVKARHILFRLDQNATEEAEKTTKEAAEKVLEKARKGEDFAALAKEYSEGPTKEKGGDLGYFSQGQMVQPFEEAAFDLKKGEVSDLVKTQFGYHIIKVEDTKEARTKGLEEVRDQIAENLAKTVRADLAHEKALSLIDQMPYDVDLAKYAAEQGVTINETGYFTQDESIPEVGGDQRLLESLFSLEKNEVSELMEIGENFYIIQVSDLKASYLPELEEVRDKAAENFKTELARKEARKAAEEFLSEVREEGKVWAEIAKTRGLSPETGDFFSRSDPIPQIGNVPGLREAAFTLGEDGRYPEKVFEDGDGAYVIRWEGYEGIDLEELKEQKDNYRDSLFQVRHRTLISDWVAHLRSKAEIEIVTPVDN
ncbi:MAG: SurA N-terminal domain-containing protein [Desulfatiglandales bacterium]